MGFLDKTPGGLIGYSDISNGVSGIFDLSTALKLSVLNSFHTKIISDNLVFHLDAGKPFSYPQSGTVISDINYNTKNYAPDPLTMPATSWVARENVTVTTGQVDPKGGTNAVRVHPNSTTDNYFGSRYDFLEQGSYYCSIWLKATASVTVPVILGDNNGNKIYQACSLTTEWKQFTFSGTIAGEVNGGIHVGGWGTWTNNTFDIFVYYPEIYRITKLNGSFINSPTYSTDGSGSINFSRASSQYIQVSSGLATFSAGITGEFFAKFSSSVGNWERLMDFGNGSGSNNILFARYSTTNDLNFHVFNGTTAYVLTATNGVQNDIWAHYVFTADGTTLKLYRNGVLLTSAASSGLPGNVARTLNYIGKSNWADAYFQGKIGIARIYDRALTIDEITKNFNAQRGRFGI